MYKIGIVARCYNKSNTIDVSFKNIINSTMFKNILVIMVDDGSTDDSKSKLYAYAKKYSNMKLLVHDKNRGHFRALVTGIKYIHDHTNCEYLTILDIDDCVTKGFYESLYKKTHENDYDVIVGKVLLYKNKQCVNNPYFNDLVIKKDGNYSPKDMKWCMWNKLIKVSLFDEFCSVIDDHMLFNFHIIGRDDYLVFLYLWKYIHNVCDATCKNEFMVYNCSDDVQHMLEGQLSGSYRLNLDLNEAIFKCCNNLEL